MEKAPIKADAERYKATTPKFKNFESFLFKSFQKTDELMYSVFSGSKF